MNNAKSIYNVSCIFYNTQSSCHGCQKLKPAIVWNITTKIIDITHSSITSLNTETTILQSICFHIHIIRISHQCLSKNKQWCLREAEVQAVHAFPGKLPLPDLFMTTSLSEEEEDKTATRAAWTCCLSVRDRNRPKHYIREYKYTAAAIYTKCKS